MNTRTGSAPKAHADDPLLAVEGLRHAFSLPGGGERQVLESLSFGLRRGEQLGLLGPNGSGKSTAFAVLAGLLDQQGGAIQFDGAPLGDGRAFRARLGVVFQSPSLDPSLSCRQNLELASALQGLSGQDAKQRVTQQLEAAGLTARANDQVKTLSGGMRRRLDIGRALLHQPRLLLMDEPTSGLDEAAFRATWDRLAAERRERELSILVTTHRPEEAERCDRIAILHGGRIVECDTPEALKSRIASDLVVVSGPEPDELAAVIMSRFELPTIVEPQLLNGEGGLVRIETDAGHLLIPKLVDAFGADRLTSVSLRRPSLADVFLKVTGAALDSDIESDIESEIDAAETSEADE